MPQNSKDKLSQVAALPFRIRDGRIEVLLVTSRETKRWLIPKGWPMKGKKPHKAAAQEAEEEAGVKGEIKNKRSEEHTSELQSRQYLVCRLLLEKKKSKENFW